jgi:hypothetical protein
LAPVKLAFYPYLTSTAVYSQIQAISQVWQKLIFCASRNSKFIDSVYEQIKETDDMISQMMRIRSLKKDSNDDGVLFARYDYFIS